MSDDDYADLYAEIRALVAAGMSYRKAAEQLGVSLWRVQRAMARPVVPVGAEQLPADPAAVARVRRGEAPYRGDGLAPDGGPSGVHATEGTRYWTTEDALAGRCSRDQLNALERYRLAYAERR